MRREEAKLLKRAKQYLDKAYDLLATYDFRLGNGGLADNMVGGISGEIEEALRIAKQDGYND